MKKIKQAFENKFELNFKDGEFSPEEWVSIWIMVYWTYRQAILTFADETSPCLFKNKTSYKLFMTGASRLAAEFNLIKAK